jgi:hypothetical protein
VAIKLDPRTVNPKQIRTPVPVFLSSESAQEEKGSIPMSRNRGRGNSNRKIGAESSRGGRRGFDLLESLGRPKYPKQPVPQLAESFSGRRLATDIGRDTVMVNRPSAVIFCNNGCNWIASTSLHWFQNNSVAVGSIDAVADALLGTLSRELYSNIVRIIEAQRLRVVRDTTLDNGGTPADSMGYFMQQWGQAFWGLRGLQGWLNAGNFNETTALIAQAINQNLFRLKSDLDRLASISMSPTWMRFMDRLCGPKAFDVNSVVVGSQWGNGANALDLTLTASIQTILTACEGALNNILNAPPAAMANDMQRILNTFAIAYGEVSPVEPKELVIDPVEYFLQVNQAISFADTVAAKIFTAPNTATQFYGPNIPILLPRGVDYSSEAVKQTFTLIRPGVYTNDSNAGVGIANAAQQVGISGNNLAVGQGTQFAAYIQNGSFTPGNQTGGAAITNLFYMINDLDVWGATATSESTNLTNETRSWEDYEIFYTPTTYLAEETEYIISKMFVDDIVNS